MKNGLALTLISAAMGAYASIGYASQIPLNDKIDQEKFRVGQTTDSEQHYRIFYGDVSNNSIADPHYVFIQLRENAHKSDGLKCTDKWRVYDPVPPFGIMDYKGRCLDMQSEETPQLIRFLREKLDYELVAVWYYINDGDAEIRFTLDRSNDNEFYGKQLERLVK